MASITVTTITQPLAYRRHPTHELTPTQIAFWRSAHAAHDAWMEAEEAAKLTQAEEVEATAQALWRSWKQVEEIAATYFVQEE